MPLLSPLLERPRNISSSYELDKYLRAGSPVAAGVTVTADTAMTVSALFNGIRIIAEDIGKLPYPVYERLPGDRRSRATSSPFWRLVHDRPFGAPNTFGLTSQQFREVLTGWALFTGNGYAFKNAPAGQVTELIPIRSDRVRYEQLPDFEVIYWVRMPDGRELPHTRRDIFHLAGFSLDGIGGAGILQLARQGIGLALAAEESQARLFRAGGRPPGVLSTDQKLQPDTIKRLREDWQDEYGGVANAHKVAILEQGLSWQTTGLSAADAELIATRKFAVTEFARWLRIAPHKLADLERATFTNIEHQSIEYVVDTVLPWAVRWDNAWNQQVIGTNRVYAELLIEGLLRGDTKTRYEGYRSAIVTGWMNRNEARRLENLDPAEGLDEFLTPMNMADAQGNPLGAPKEPA